MVWKLRGNEWPDYGPNSDLFTIRMHHNGKIVDLGKRVYMGGEVSHIDFCDPDEISMVEIMSMANEIGIKGCKQFHFSLLGVDDCNLTSVLQCDNDSLKLFNFIDGNRMVGVFVEHDNVDEETVISHEIRQGPEGSLNSISDYERLNLDGHYDNGEFVQENEEPMQGNEEPVFYNENLDLTGDSDGEQSVGSDSELSSFHDSDSEYSIDDLLFDENIDHEVEWRGFHMSTEEPQDMPKKGGKAAQNISIPRLVSRSKLGFQDPDFYIGQDWPDSKTFRAAVRQHSILHGREINFSISERRKVRAICEHKTCSVILVSGAILICLMHM